MLPPVTYKLARLDICECMLTWRESDIVEPLSDAVSSTRCRDGCLTWVPPVAAHAIEEAPMDQVEPHPAEDPSAAEASDDP